MEEIIKNILKEEIIELKKMGNSYSSNVYLITTSDNKYIFKLLKTDEKRVVESKALKKLYRYIKVPKLVKTGIYNENYYIIMEFIKGINYNDSDANKLKDTELIKISEILEKLHNIPITDENDEWYKYLYDRINNTYNTLYNKEEFNDNIYNILIKNLNDFIKDNYKKSLVHMDFRLGNLIINDNNIYIIDFESIKVGDPIFDFIKIKRYLSKSQFNILLKSIKNEKDIERKINFYNLFDAYTALEWCINNDQKNSEYYKLNMKEIKKYEKRKF